MPRILDANVVLRYLLDDNLTMAEQAKAARRKVNRDDVFTFDRKLDRLLKTL